MEIKQSSFHLTDNLHSGGVFMDHHSLQLAGEVVNFDVFLKHITGELTGFELEDRFNMTGWQDLLILICE